MSSGTNITPSPPAPTPAPVVPAINWQSVLHVALTVAGMLLTQFIAGSKTAPAPNGGGQVNPAPSPAPTPTPLFAGLTVTDSSGNSLTANPNAGQLFTVAAKAGQSIKASISGKSPGEFRKISASEIDCTLTATGTLQVISWGGTGEPTVTMITANQGAQPPPPDQDNNVTPVATGYRVIILRDVEAQQASETADQINAIHSPKVISLLNSKCTKDASGLPQWHLWDKDTDTSKQSAEWQTMMAACVSQVKAKSLTLPVLCVESGNTLTLSAITNESSLLSTLNVAFGS